MARQQFKISGGSFKATPPKTSFGGGGGQSNQLMAYMLGQKKAEEAQAQIPGGVATKAVGSNVTFESPQSRFFTAEAQNQLTRIKQLKQVTKSLEELALGLPTEPVEAISKFAISKTTGGRFGTEAITTYSEAIPAASAGTYRAVTGDNRLSEPDAAARARPLFWHPLQGKETREGKFSFLNFMLDEAERNVTPGEPTSDLESLARWESFIRNSTQKFQESQQASGSPQGLTNQSDKKAQYNSLRTQGLSSEEAKRRLGF